jgi:hypothetical protein
MAVPALPSLRVACSALLQGTARWPAPRLRAQGPHAGTPAFRALPARSGALYCRQLLFSTLGRLDAGSSPSEGRFHRQLTANLISSHATLNPYCARTGSLNGQSCGWANTRLTDHSQGIHSKIGGTLLKASFFDDVLNNCIRQNAQFVEMTSSSCLSKVSAHCTGADVCILHSMSTTQTACCCALTCSRKHVLPGY